MMHTIRAASTVSLFCLSMIHIHPQLDFLSSRGEVRVAIANKDHPISAAVCDYFATHTNELNYLSDAEYQQLTRDTFWYICAPYADDLAQCNPSQDTLKTLPETLLTRLKQDHSPDFFFFHTLAFMLSINLAAQVNANDRCQAKRINTGLGPNTGLRLKFLMNILENQYLPHANHGDAIIKNALTFLLEHADDAVHPMLAGYLSHYSDIQPQDTPWYISCIRTVLVALGSCCSDCLAEDDMHDIMYDHINFQGYVQFSPADTTLRIDSQEDERWKNNRHVF